MTRRVRATAGVVLALLALALIASALSLPGQYDIFQPRWPEAISISGFTRPELFSLCVRLLLLGPALLLLGGTLGGLKPPPARTSAALAALLVGVMATAVFQGMPIVDDEATYRMQADLLASGRLADPPTPPAEQWHREPFTVFTAQATTGKYLFGTALGLVPGSWVGFPPLVHLLFAAATVLLLAAGLRHAGLSEETQRWGALFLASSPMFLFTTATLQSQAPALFGLAALVWGLQRGGFAVGLAAGLAFGFSVTARPQLALPCLAVLLVRYGWPHRRYFAGLLLTTAPWIALILAYNVAVTGEAFTLPGAFYNSERYGFGEVDGQPPHTLWRSVLIALITLGRLNGWALGWPLSLLGAALWLARGRPEARGVAPWGWIALATFAFQAGYYFGGITDTGPIYYYAVLPFLVVSTAAVINLRPQWARYAVVFLAVGTTSFLVEHALRLRGLTELVAAPVRLAEKTDARSLVFIERSLVGSDPRGQVRGVPLRDRWGDVAHLFYPRPTEPSAAEALQRRWSGRPCRYVWFESGEWRIGGCEEMSLRGLEYDRREPPWF